MLITIDSDDDDFFSADLTDEERKRKFAGIKAPTYVVFGDLDETVPDKTVYKSQSQSFCQASPLIKVMPIIPCADHSLNSIKATEFFFQLIITVLKDLEYIV